MLVTRASMSNRPPAVMFVWLGPLPPAIVTDAVGVELAYVTPRYLDLTVFEAEARALEVMVMSPSEFRVLPARR